MNRQTDSFTANGYLVIPEVLSLDDIAEIADHLREFSGRSARTRRLLRFSWCSDLAGSIRLNGQVAEMLPSSYVSIQATYFPKCENDNWKVPLHRDFFVPLKERRDTPGWSGWSEKEGVQFARPPTEILERLVAIRVHLEASTTTNGPLFVVPGSHLGPSDSDRVACEVPAGGALAMRPLVLHASSKVQEGTRRVLHFLFGPEHLEHGLAWADAV